MPDLVQFTRQAAELVACNDSVPTQRMCSCVVIWDVLTERHVWLNESRNYACGHPGTGEPYVGGD